MIDEKRGFYLITQHESLFVSIEDCANLDKSIQAIIRIRKRSALGTTQSKLKSQTLLILFAHHDEVLCHLSSPHGTTPRCVTTNDNPNLRETIVPKVSLGFHKISQFQREV